MQNNNYVRRKLCF